MIVQQIADVLATALLGAAHTFLSRNLLRRKEKEKRRRPDSNRGIKDLQSFALPLGYAAMIVRHLNITISRDCQPKTCWDRLRGVSSVWSTSPFFTESPSIKTLSPRRSRLLWLA
jgi:hypothetical protein